MHTDRNHAKAEPKPEQWHPRQKEPAYQTEKLQKAMHNISRGRCGIGIMDLCQLCISLRLMLYYKNCKSKRIDS